MPIHWKPFLAPSTLALKFAIKTLLAGGLALWCAFRFDLEQPQWALMTVLIVSQPLSGMVVAKGLFRLLGTLVGTAMSVLMIALFAQAPWLFLLAISLWLGLCTAASTSLRNHVSYAFVLSGYTVAIIGLPAVDQPLLVFEQAVARCTEICLGIICASAVSAILWPQRVEQNLDKQAHATWLLGMQAARGEIDPRQRQPQGLLNALSKIVEVDAQRDHAWFEGERGRRRAGALALLSRDLLSLLRTARGVARQRARLSEEEERRVERWLAALASALEGADPASMLALRKELAQVAVEPQWSNDQRYLLTRCSVLLLKAVNAEKGMRAVASGEVEGRVGSAGTLSWHRDLQMALFYGARSALALLGLSVYWIYTAWPAASGAMLLAAVVCSLFANRDNAVAIGLSFLRGIVYAIPAAMLVSQWLLPQWNGFPLLCLAMGVPLFFATLGMAVPVTAGTATSFAIHFIVLVAPRNQMDYNLATLLNSAQGVLIGVGFAVVIFRLLTLRPGWLTRRLLDATCVDLGRLTRRPLAQAENWFGGRMADRLLRLARHANLLPEQERRRWDDGLLALDLGNELIHLRACLEGARGVLRKARDRFLGELGELLEAGPAGPRSDRLERISLPLREALERDARHDDEASRLARAALAQLLFTWQQWCHQEESHESA
ncbi:FUSC family protein [Pseudomonas aeruginosa]|uniref:FUSC family protein n=1 Tax=Pseudomonas aeruginosa TaxID=287 RepID=UPI00044C872B|nr:FUSC family protein [Pseudomonas aeruginosa]APJ40477.1 fusaric acid resistance protein region [Pseudomonas aeruginosa]APJ46096.1 fusaric acid resistance protein region [Pseudomonas aeruginosa]APJ53842.1 fusaric acid resistance protein region [Pseudomonas aeruginosa]EIU2704020.1 FUSC family protein [Pseudomonas aeruginosa]EKB9358527.1 FUSC family protein [Pseudomonas aeruginosa]